MTGASQSLVVLSCHLLQRLAGFRCVTIPAHLRLRRPPHSHHLLSPSPPTLLLQLVATFPTPSLLNTGALPLPRLIDHQFSSNLDQVSW